VDQIKSAETEPEILEEILGEWAAEKAWQGVHQVLAGMVRLEGRIRGTPESFNQGKGAQERTANFLREFLALAESARRQLAEPLTVRRIAVDLLSGVSGCSAKCTRLNDRVLKEMQDHENWRLREQNAELRRINGALVARVALLGKQVLASD